MERQNTKRLKAKERERERDIESNVRERVGDFGQCEMSRKLEMKHRENTGRTNEC